MSTEKKKYPDIRIFAGSWPADTRIQNFTIRPGLTCIRVHLHVHLHVHEYMCTSTCTRVHVHEYMYTSTCTRVHVHEYMYTSTCTRVHVHMHCAQILHNSACLQVHSVGRWAKIPANRQASIIYYRPQGDKGFFLFLVIIVSWVNVSYTIQIGRYFYPV